MILSWNQDEMPAKPGVLDCSKVAVNFYNRANGEYLGPVAWLDTETGEYEVRVRDPKDNKPVVVDGRFLYERRIIAPRNIHAFLRVPTGEDLCEVSLEYVQNAATLMSHGKVLAGIE